MSRESVWPVLRAGLCFALIGPLFGTLLVIGPFMVQLLGELAVNEYRVFLVIVMAGYVLGGVPALLTGCLHGVMRLRWDWHQVLPLTMVLGALLSWGWMSLLSPGEPWFSLGVGAIASLIAVLCYR